MPVGTKEQTAAHRRDALCSSTKIQKQAAFGISPIGERGDAVLSEIEAADGEKLFPRGRSLPMHGKMFKTDFKIAIFVRH
jgi:hypothetical protein